MRIVVAPDSFKGSLSAQRAADSVAAGWRSVRPNDVLEIIPMADGGEGTLEAMRAAIPHARVHTIAGVAGADFAETVGWWITLPDGTAIVELAQVAGIAQMSQLDPWAASSFGLGQVMRAAILAGAHHLVISLGGSGSTDGGAGAIVALGAKLLCSAGTAVPPGARGLRELDRVDLSEVLSPPSGGVTLLNDVTSPLLGPHGAVPVYGPQKGFSVDEIPLAEEHLRYFATQLGATDGAISVRADEPGMGAAGGTAFGISSIWPTRMTLGAQHIAELSGLTSAIAQADLVITGEGSFDSQSANGKVVGTIATLAAEAGVELALVVGTSQLPLTHLGCTLVELSRGNEDPMRDAAILAERAGAQLARAAGDALNNQQ